MRNAILWSTPWAGSSVVVTFMLVGLRTVAGLLADTSTHQGYLLRVLSMSHRRLVGGLATLFFTAAASAQGLPVLHEGDGGVPLGPYMVQTMSANDEPGTSALVTLPIRSGLKSGVMLASATWPRSSWISSPFFVIGADERSVRWLIANKQQLQSLGATGLVVDVATEPQFKALEKAGDGVVLMPWSSPWLTATLKQVNGGVYPVLIGVDGRLHQNLTASRGHNHE